MFQRTTDNAQVFHEELVRHKGATLSVESVLDDARGVDVVQDWVCVTLVACGEYDDVEVFAQLF